MVLNLAFFHFQLRQGLDLDLSHLFNRIGDLFLLLFFLLLNHLHHLLRLWLLLLLHFYFLRLCFNFNFSLINHSYFLGLGLRLNLFLISRLCWFLIKLFWLFRFRLRFHCRAWLNFGRRAFWTRLEWRVWCWIRLHHLTGKFLIALLFGHNCTCLWLYFYQIYY